jgi:hypothetical protein
VKRAVAVVVDGALREARGHEGGPEAVPC